MASKISNFITKILLGLLLVFMIAGVAVWGINDILVGNRNKTIAKVGNSAISEYELENIVNNNKMQLMHSGMNISEEFKTVLRNNALVNLIGDRLLQNEFRNLNLQVDGKEILKNDYLNQDIDKEKLKAIVRAQGGEEFFLTKISKEKKIDFLQGSITAITPIDDTVIKASYNFENQTKNIEYVELNPNIVKNIPEPSEAELKSFYEENKEYFLTPEYRTVSYVVIDEKSLKDKSEDVATQLHDISNKILDKIAGGETLEEIAKEYNLNIKQIKSVNAQGKPLEGLAISDLPKVENFVPAIFATEQGEISDILESDNGKTYALIRVDSINEKRIKTLDEVKELAIQALKVKKKSEKLVEIAKKLKEDLDAGKITLADFAAKNAVNVKQKTQIGTKNKDFSPQFISEILNLKKGQYSNINKTNEGALIIAKVNEINPASTPEKLDLFQFKSKMQEQASQEIMAQYLDYLKQKYNVSVYAK